MTRIVAIVDADEASVSGVLAGEACAGRPQGRSSARSRIA
jgi:hypothetical protein